MIPVVATAVVPVYTIAGSTAPAAPLQLDRQTLADIFMGKITQWDDPAILRTNEGELRERLSGPIHVVYRTGRSSLTRVFTGAMASFSSDWLNRLGVTSGIEDWGYLLGPRSIGIQGRVGNDCAALNSIAGYVLVPFCARVVVRLCFSWSRYL